MAENEISTPEVPAVPLSPNADEVLLELAGTLNFTAVQRNHPEWTRERLNMLLTAAADHFRPDNQPSLSERLNALLAILAAVVAGRLLLIFVHGIEPLLFYTQYRLDYPLPVATRLAMGLYECGIVPILALCVLLLATYGVWAWSSRNRLERFASWVYIGSMAVWLVYPLVCLYPIFCLWLRSAQLSW